MLVCNNNEDYSKNSGQPTFCISPKNLLSKVTLLAANPISINDTS